MAWCVTPLKGERPRKFHTSTPLHCCARPDRKRSIYHFSSSVCLRGEQVPLQAARRRASERIIHYLLLLLKRDGAVRSLGYLFLRRTADRRMDGQTDELLLPSTFNNEKRSRAFLMCTDTTHTLELQCEADFPVYKQGSSLSTVKTVPNQQ
jgi:hypothetical protein